ncbi:hypothetical protein [Paenibacillus macerans]|uniref:hypothetical protein n=1 Tax=Paenibacillus macerans TaxID=44252 RepID=UPI001D131253|nr:hypothetical protein [Paenibacillus macerans]MBS5914793.1 hypothetical protein [Paenibacillus macerans]
MAEERLKQIKHPLSGRFARLSRLIRKLDQEAEKKITSGEGDISCEKQICLGRKQIYLGEEMFGRSSYVRDH